jgi:2-octaprenyl-6-methoxyphenol hydroxylase
MEAQRDVLIVGGGPVGATLALALAGSGLDVEVLEARATVGESADDRTLAVSHGTRLIFERLGVWDAAGMATPIESIHVSQRGGFGRSCLEAASFGLPALGYVLSYARLQRALGEALRGRSDIRVSTAVEVDTVEVSPAHASITCRKEGRTRVLGARLLAIADGGTRLAGQAGAKLRHRDYAQQAVVGVVEASRPHAFRAYERFTPDGPVALLPFGQTYALIWTAAPEAAAGLVSLPDAAFLAALQDHFGDRPGRFLAIGPRSRFALSLRYALDPVLERTVLLGNAAQALHPIAGQGLNLGLRDAWDLAQLLLARAAEDPGTESTLKEYRAARRLDRLGGIAVTDSLVRIFSNDAAPLRMLRGGALALLDILPAAKRAFIQRMVFGNSL